MQSFVEQHMLSLLVPTSQHVRDVQGDVRALKAEVQAQCLQLNSKGSAVDQHDQQLSALWAELHQVSLKMGKMRSEISNEIVDAVKLNRLRVEEISRKVEAQITDMDHLLKDLQLCWKSTDADIHKLQDRVETLEAMARPMCGDIARIDQLVEEWRHEHLGLSERVEHTKRQGEDHKAGLQKLMATTTNQDREAKDGIAKVGKQIKDLGIELAACNQNVMGHEERLTSFGANLKRTMDEIGTVRSELEDEKRTNQEQEGILKNMNLGQAVDLLFQRTAKTSNDVEGILTELHEEEGLVRKLTARVDADLGVISSHTEEIKRLEKERIVLRDHCSDHAERLTRQEKVHGDLKEQADVACADIRRLRVSLKASEKSLTEHAQRLEETDARQADSERRLEDTDGQLTGLRAEVGRHGEAAAKTAMSLDLAHEYLNGVGKGLAKAHSRMVDGHEELLPFKKAPTRNLPSLPSARPTNLGATAPARLA